MGRTATAWKKWATWDEAHLTGWRSLTSSEQAVNNEEIGECWTINDEGRWQQLRVMREEE
ncbi:hypothetical protein Csa_022836 [Cucumis sativus]|uniref:Uncharacterized protein n=1 Tax=Cucumis sativus TaxID=3659 RepID=A0A0A0LXV9_CUCSA|nr:hypothetical protein Csa_022836 [Cucumis sativus]